MLLPRSRRRLSSISERITAGEPPLNPPLVATMTLSGMGESAAPIVSSLCPPVYRCAVSITCTPAAIAALMNAMFVCVFVSRLVPRPIRAISTPANFTRSSPRASTHRVDRHDHTALARPVSRAQVDAVLGADQVCELVFGIMLDLRVAPQFHIPMRIGVIEEHHADLWGAPEVLRLLPAGVERDLHRAVLRQEPQCRHLRPSVRTDRRHDRDA